MSRLNMPAIIPVAGMESQFGMEWDASLVMVGPNYTAIEAAIYECIHAGCSSIWIVANDDVAPLIRHRIGEWATDVDSVERGRYIRFGTEKHQEVPIYYVPIHPRHRDKVDCYGWSVIYGVNVAYWVMTKMGRWTQPHQYYVSFPLGAMDPREVYKHRSLLRKSAPFYFSHDGKTVKDGLPLSFVLEPDEWRRAKRKIITNAASYKAPAEGEYPTELLPPEERRRSRRFTLAEVFGEADTGTHQEMEYFYDLTSWEGYVKFLSSELGQRTKRPGTTTMYRGRSK